MGGKIDSFCRERGHGFVMPITEGSEGEKIFLHISDVEDEYVPKKGDRVQFKLAPIPPHMSKFQAVQCKIVERGKTRTMKSGPPNHDQRKKNKYCCLRSK